MEESGFALDRLQLGGDGRVSPKALRATVGKRPFAGKRTGSGAPGKPVKQTFREERTVRLLRSASGLVWSEHRAQQGPRNPRSHRYPKWAPIVAAAYRAWCQNLHSQANRRGRPSRTPDRRGIPCGTTRPVAGPDLLRPRDKPRNPARRSPENPLPDHAPAIGLRLKPSSIAILSQSASGWISKQFDPAKRERAILSYQYKIEPG